MQRIELPKITDALRRKPAVALVGPRQVGKTTLAFEIAKNYPSLYLDLENPDDRMKLKDARAYLSLHEDKLVILDEVHRVPELFDILRGIIDEGRRKGKGTARFLLLGSASMELLKQTETLAGRIAYIDIPPLTINSVDTPLTLDEQWLRGGYPESLFAQDDSDSYKARQEFIRSYLERDVPLFAPRMPSSQIERIWSMLSHNQGALLNVAQLAGSLGVQSPAANRYVGLLEDLLLLRRLRPLHSNIKKQLIKTPKTYVRDSGLLHALLGIRTLDELLGHPIAGASWEGFVLENILANIEDDTKPFFYRSRAGAEIDLILDFGGTRGCWAIEIKRSTSPSVSHGVRIAQQDIKPKQSFCIYQGTERYPMGSGMEAVGLKEFLTLLKGTT